MNKEKLITYNQFLEKNKDVREKIYNAIEAKYPKYSKFKSFIANHKFRWILGAAFIFTFLLIILSIVVLVMGSMGIAIFLMVIFSINIVAMLVFAIWHGILITKHRKSMKFDLDFTNLYRESLLKLIPEAKEVEIKNVVLNNNFLIYKDEYGIYNRAGQVAQSAGLIFKVGENKFTTKNHIFQWQIQGPNSSTTYTSGIGIMNVEMAQNDFSNLSLLIGSKHLGKELNKEKLLENENFVKTFKPRSNDETKTRMLLTPLVMEEMLKMHSSLFAEHPIIDKKMNQINIPFKTDINVKWKTTDFTKIEKKITPEVMPLEIWNEISQDIYELYKIYYYLNIMPLF